MALRAITLLLLACSEEPAEKAIEVETAAPEPESWPQMQPAALATRISLDVRGRRPTLEELDAVEADPSLLETWIPTWLEDPGWTERLVSLYAEIYWTRADKYIVGADGDGQFQDLTYKALFMRSVGEEPLRLLADVAAHDQPWTDLLTVDYSMGNDKLFAHFPIEPLEEGLEGWQRVRYLDGRPAVGVLGTNGMWWRYTSTVDNKNRGRASALSRILLCDDRYLAPIDFLATTDQVDPQERISTDPTCVGCHVSLDPVASHFYGFWRHHPESFSEATRYYPAREQEWVSISGVAPGYYGEPTSSLWDLAQHMAGDPRTVSCAVDQTWGFLVGRVPEVEELDAWTEDRDAFIRGGLVLRQLWTEVLSDPRYRCDDSAVEGCTAVKTANPDLLASQVEALTGYRWSTREGIDMMVNDDFGLRILAGGVDGLVVNQRPEEPAATVSLVQKRLAQAAAAYAVQAEGDLPLAERRLFLDIEDLSATPAESERRLALARLSRRVLGHPADPASEETLALDALWLAVAEESGDPALAWQSVLIGLLRHPDLLEY